VSVGWNYIATGRILVVMTSTRLRSPTEADAL
jgi:hypothetical protein